MYSCLSQPVGSGRQKEEIIAQFPNKSFPYNESEFLFSFRCLTSPSPHPLSLHSIEQCFLNISSFVLQRRHMIIQVWNHVKQKKYRNANVFSFFWGFEGELSL